MSDWQADPTAVYLSHHPDVWCDWMEDMGEDTYTIRFILIYGYGDGDGYGDGYGNGYGNG